jgi:Arc/MetJ-type ribon-helix-helix transcriptional regulator
VTYDGKSIAVYSDEDWIELLDEFVEKSHFESRSAAIRSLVMLGMRSYVSEPPLSPSESKQSSDAEFSPTTIREIIPEGEENSVHLFEELPDKIENQLLDTVVDDPEIQRDGNEVYR